MTKYICTACIGRKCTVETTATYNPLSCRYNPQSCEWRVVVDPHPCDGNANCCDCKGVLCAQK